MKVFIVVKESFEAVHSWPGCNKEEVSFLMFPHRHVFHVELVVEKPNSEVLGDREVEFIVLKRRLRDFLRRKFEGRDLGGMSCEEIGKRVMEEFSGAVGVSVFEDGENGVRLVK